ncbi:MAG TPA: succinate dehydrogenase, hydrophobic membrane anchor protein [Steroidobacteraceae bacterium]|nr:succinate dehydrogenase, hydrophobic membrane anchor protein [Steroidobacteraceae bacterium]
MNLRSPLAHALGLGAAKEGVSHWWWQRLTAIALVPLALWFIWSLIGIETLTYSSVHAWLAMPMHALGVILLVGILALHSQLGVQVVIEDYVHDHAVKLLALVASSFAHVLIGAAGVLSVLIVALGGSA